MLDREPPCSTLRSSVQLISVLYSTVASPNALRGQALAQIAPILPLGPGLPSNARPMITNAMARRLCSRLSILWPHHPTRHPARDYMNFGPPQAPAILAVGQAGTARRSIRRVYSYELEYDLILGLFLNTLRLNHIERDVVPEFVQ